MIIIYIYDIDRSFQPTAAITTDFKACYKPSLPRRPGRRRRRPLPSFSSMGSPERNCRIPGIGGVGRQNRFSGKNGKP